MPNERIVAVGLLTKNDVSLLGPAFDRLWPIQTADCFTDLLIAIDEAERGSQSEQIITIVERA